LSIAVVAPVAIGVMPGVELSWQTALVPVLNVSLATKDVVSGTINPIYVGLTYLSLFALAAIGVSFCVYWFSREETLFRT
jgi:sodium transport system permease protein